MSEFDIERAVNPLREGQLNVHESEDFKEELSTSGRQEDEEDTFSPRRDHTLAGEDNLSEQHETESNLGNETETKKKQVMVYSYTFILILFGLLMAIGVLSVIAIILFTNIHINKLVNESSASMSKSDRDKARFILLAVSIFVFILYILALIYSFRLFRSIIRIYEIFVHSLIQFFEGVNTLDMEPIPISVRATEELSKITEKRVFKVTNFSPYNEISRLQEITALANLYIRMYKDMLPYHVVQISEANNEELEQMESPNSDENSLDRASTRRPSTVNSVNSPGGSNAAEASTSSGLLITRNSDDARNEYSGTVTVTVSTPEKLCRVESQRESKASRRKDKDKEKERDSDKDSLENSKSSRKLSPHTSFRNKSIDDDENGENALRSAINRFKAKNQNETSTSKLLSSSNRHLPSSSAARITQNESGKIGLRRRYSTLVTVCFSDFFNIANIVSPDLAKEISKAFIAYSCKCARRNKAFVVEFKPDRITMSWNSFKPCSNHQEKGLLTAIEIVSEVQAKLYNRFPEMRPFQIPTVHAIGFSTHILAGSIKSGDQNEIVMYAPSLNAALQTLTLQMGLMAPVMWLDKPECILPDLTACIPVDIISLKDNNDPHFMNIDSYIVDPAEDYDLSTENTEWTLYEVCTPVSATVYLDFIDAFTDFKDQKYETALKKYATITERAEAERLEYEKKNPQSTRRESAPSPSSSIKELMGESSHSFDISSRLFFQAYRLRDLSLLYAKSRQNSLEIDEATKARLRNCTIPNAHKRVTPHWYVFDPKEPSSTDLQNDSSSVGTTEDITSTENFSPRTRKYDYTKHRKSTVDDIKRDIQLASNRSGSLSPASTAPNLNQFLTEHTLTPTITVSTSGTISESKYLLNLTDSSPLKPTFEEGSFLVSAASATGLLSPDSPAQLIARQGPLNENEFEDGTMVYRLSEKKLGQTPTSEVRLALSYTGSLVAVKSILLSHSQDANNHDETEGGEEAAPGAFQRRRANGVQRRRNQRRGLMSAAIDVEAITNEVSLLSQLLDPHIVRYISAVVQPNRLLLVMEYVSGGSLHALMEQYYSTMTLAQARIYLRDVLKGLEYLHKKGIIHRDIKPQNVLVPLTGNCKLSDFGISKEISNDPGGARKFDGTPFYMAPEAASGEAVEASDIWSFGIMLAEVLTNKLPWPTNMNPHAMRYQLVKNDQLKPEIQGEGLMTEDAKYVFECCTRRDPRQRPKASAILKMPFFNSRSLGGQGQQF